MASGGSLVNNTDLDFTVLSEREQSILSNWLDTHAPPLSVSTSASLFGLFLNGQTCDMIQKLNPQFTLGSILHARIRDRWDQQRSETAGQMFSTVREKVIKGQLDAIEAVSLMLTASSKMQSEKFLRYIQTGDESELAGAMTIRNIGDMKKAIESLQLLTGQRTSENPSVVNVTVKGGDGAQMPISVSSGQEPLPLPPKMDGATANVLIRKALQEAKEKK